MPTTYTNRKGVTYHLCKGEIRSGKPRYFFRREPCGEPVEQIPEGYRISESVNGIVSLARDRPSKILPEELAAVEKTVRRHPKAGNYRVYVRGNRIRVYERVGLDPRGLLRPVGKELPWASTAAEEALATLGRHAQFEPVLRFTLIDEGSRIFQAERMCYLGSIDDFIEIRSPGPVDDLARELVPKLGTDAFFEPYY